VIGKELRALGIFMNLGPVADVSNEDQPGLLTVQRRTFASDPDMVALLSTAALLGMADAGVTGVLKHFPGQGAALGDPHTNPVSLAHDREQLDTVDLIPFKHGIAAGARAIMTAHISYPGVTGSSLPATISPEVINDMLRFELGFTGLVITDALNMEAARGGGSELEIALQSIRAGADVLLKPRDPTELHRGLVDAVDSGMISRERVEQSVRRILALKIEAGLFGPAPELVDPQPDEVLGSAAHMAVVDEIRRVARRGRN